MSGSEQLLLDLKPAQLPGFENFVAGTNAELVTRLKGVAHYQNYDAIYIWGPKGSGKSHLLQATATLAVERRPIKFSSGIDISDSLAAPSNALLVIDDIDLLNSEAQIALFRMFNSARMIGLAFLLSGPQPPLQLDLREDLRTRIGQSLIYEVHLLSDEEKSAALRRHAQLRGMRLDESVVQYLMRHGRRDLPSLMAILDGLDRASLMLKRQPTLPLLRELLQSSLEID